MRHQSITKTVLAGIAKAVAEQQKTAAENAGPCRPELRKGEPINNMWARVRETNRAKILANMRAAGDPLTRSQMLEGTGIKWYDQIKKMAFEGLIIDTGKKIGNSILYALPESEKKETKKC